METFSFFLDGDFEAPIAFFTGLDKMINRALFSFASVHWSTPDILYKELDGEFRFTLDPCPINGKDGLIIPWTNERIYCNPPYGKDVDKWLDKAREAEIAVFLLPSRTDTKWFHKYASLAKEIRFLKGRLKFGDSKNTAPFPSVLLIFENTGIVSKP